MPRKARKKDRNKPHHIMSRSIQEVPLFQTYEDKDVYMELMVNAVKIHQIQVIACCLMDTHVHLLVDPKGSDISKFMKQINNPYAKKYNKKYDRRGHLYADRFKNIIIDNDAQLLNTTVYIYNNAKDLLSKG